MMSYNGALHLMFTAGGVLHHLVNAGTGWTDKGGSKTHSTAVGAGSGIYDGRIYTAYNVEVDTQVNVDDAVTARIGHLLRSLYRMQGEVYFYDDLAGGPLLPPRQAPATAQPVQVTAANATRLPADVIKQLRDAHTKVRPTGPLDEFTFRAFDSVLSGDPYDKTVTMPVKQVGYQVYDGTSWSGEAIIPVNATTPPSLAVYHEKGDPTRGRLMLNYAGTESYNPPPPPPPQPVGTQVVGTPPEGEPHRLRHRLLVEGQPLAAG